MAAKKITVSDADATYLKDTYGSLSRGLTILIDKDRDTNFPSLASKTDQIGPVKKKSPVGDNQGLTEFQKRVLHHFFPDFGSVDKCIEKIIDLIIPDTSKTGVEILDSETGKIKKEYESKFPLSGSEQKWKINLRKKQSEETIEKIRKRVESIKV